MEAAPNIVNVLSFASIMVSFGAVGGFARLMIDWDPTTDTTGQSAAARTHPFFVSFLYVCFRSLILGIAAAIAVPLFLSIASLGQDKPNGGLVQKAYVFVYPAAEAPHDEQRSEIRQTAPSSRELSDLPQGTEGQDKTLDLDAQSRKKLRETDTAAREGSPDETDNKREKGTANDFLILAGFCVIAGLSARSFMESLSDAIGKQVDKAKSEVREEARAEIAEKVEKAVFEEVTTVTGPGQQLGEAALRLLDVFIQEDTRSVPIQRAEEFAKKEEIDLEDATDELASKGFLKTDAEDLEGNKDLRLRGWGTLRILPKLRLDADSLRLLGKLSDLPDRPRPTAQLLAADMELDEGQVASLLPRLENWGLIKKSRSEPQGWLLRGWGREVLKQRGNKFQARIR